MAQPIHPQHGARFQIERLAQEKTTAQYRVQIHVSDGVYQAKVKLSTLSIDMVWEEEQSSQPPKEQMPAWMKKHAEALMRPWVQDVLRGETWTRGVRRWRDAPKSESGE